MNKALNLLSMGLLVVWLGTSCKKDSAPPDDNTPPVVVEPAETEPHILTAIPADIPGNCDGYYEALPPSYHQNERKYPLLIYFHGSGQIGNGNSDLWRVLTAGTALVLKEKRFPPNIVVNKQNMTFVILMPQFRGQPSNSDVKGFVDYAKSHYRFDPARVYLSGSSMGARVLTEFACTFPDQQAAIVPMAGALFYDLNKKAKNIADYKVAAWLFHNENDQSINVSESKNFVAAVNSFNPSIRAKLTIFPWSDSPQGHDAWTVPTNPGYRENGVNIYEWMLQYKK